MALHPSGYYMAAGFIERVMICHILHDELRTFLTLEIKNCSKMKFSNGGQYLALTDQKNLFLYASYTMENLLPNNKPIKCPSTSISQIAFNEKDTFMVLISNDGFVFRFDLITFQKKGECNIERFVDFKACIFLNDPYDELRLIAVGGGTD